MLAGKSNQGEAYVTTPGGDAWAVNDSDNAFVVAGPKFSLRVVNRSPLGCNVRVAVAGEEFDL